MIILKTYLKQILLFIIILFFWLLSGLIFKYDPEFYSLLKLPSFTLSGKWISIIWFIIYILNHLLLSFHFYTLYSNTERVLWKLLIMICTKSILVCKKASPIRRKQFAIAGWDLRLIQALASWQGLGMLFTFYKFISLKRQ